MVKTVKEEVTLPFELGIIEDHFIEVFPSNRQYLALLQRKSIMAFKKLSATIVPHPDKDGAFVIPLPKYYGLSAGETQKLEGSSAAYRTAISSFQKLLVDIHERTGLEIKKVQEAMGSPLEHLDILGPDDVAAIADVSAQLTQSQTDDSNLVTVIIQQRLCPSWNAEDTGSLHQDLFKEFVNYCTAERNQWKEPVEDEGKSEENQNSNSSEEA